eukprot:TRINITY_DN25098_c0_g1_i1.p1 TRINITY_DN25098_c0_g1~~TRINITY_DN25098_c0_g1_i1.p1  ORF type:complete len:537 (+),score=103.13 TRINITY_DN25098_c0_g1_i1:58-1611(+)
MAAAANAPAVPSSLQAVKVPQGMDVPFRDFSTIYYWSVVDKVTSKGAKQERVIVLCATHLFVCDFNGTIYRVARHADVDKCAVQVQGAAGWNHPSVAFRFQKSAQEPSILLLIRPDPRNPPQCRTTDQLVACLDRLRRPQVGGQELPVEHFASGRVMHKSPEMGPWEKPPGYKTPQDKMKLYHQDPSSLRAGTQQPPNAPDRDPGPGEAPVGDIYLLFPQGAIVAPAGSELRGSVTSHDPPNTVYVDIPGQGVVPFEAALLRRVRFGEQVVEVHLQNPQEELGIDFRAPTNQDCVTIVDVDAGAAASRAGLTGGLDITGADGKPVRSGRELVNAIGEARQAGKTMISFVVVPSQDAEFDDDDGEWEGGDALPPPEDPNLWTEEQEQELQYIEDELIQTRLALKRSQERIREVRAERDLAVMQQYKERQRSHERETARRDRDRRRKTPGRLLERELGRLWMRHCGPNKPRKKEKRDRIRDGPASELFASGYEGKDPIAGVLVRHLDDTRVGGLRTSLL